MERASTTAQGPWTPCPRGFGRAELYEPLAEYEGPGMIVSRTGWPTRIPVAGGTAMNDSTPISPLARTVLTRIQAAPPTGRAALRRILFGAIAIGVLAVVTWAAQRRRVEQHAVVTSEQMQVRPAISLTPARRIGAPNNTTPPTNDASVPAPANH